MLSFRLFYLLAFVVVFGLIKNSLIKLESLEWMLSFESFSTRKSYYNALQSIERNSMNLLKSLPQTKFVTENTLFHFWSWMLEPNARNSGICTTNLYKVFYCSTLNLFLENFCRLPSRDVIYCNLLGRGAFGIKTDFLETYAVKYLPHWES